MTNFRTGLFSVFSLIIFTFFVVFLSFDIEVSALSISQNDKLVERIAKDFSNKFCNGIGFGLSQESAFDFARKENMAIYKNKKGIENIDTESIAEKVSISVAEKCGYSLEISNSEWVGTLKKTDLN